ncbi:MAG: hypothetical protein CVV32_10680 [Methanomicrobiales archaeon HGW-Methanomicrobiales-3]|jgi:hypothetical protein|nr:MAG: hypothetical protein CVV32_10680 [Methanomicrobiales archaeon HGW-Methanomicrobiales-3]
MGRSFLSVRLGVRSLAERWERVSGKLDRDSREHAVRLTGLAKNHSSEAFFGCDNPLEAMVFSALLEIRRNQGEEDDDVGP